MAQRRHIVRLSSKGQIVIPASIRRRLQLKTGQSLVVRSGDGRDVIFSPVEASSPVVDASLEKARSWVERNRRNLVDELHDRRRRERETAKRERRRR
ncbi:MAG: AbrB/MazE/SpoVT family DNA-binding domain-containing protein [Planctomycetes bacterium]|nr:AbrB/MazE/SpoVT family DNA-binding domain-containing protein [Planctomycetota bacterium]